jgi:hypothetical protein
MLPQREAQVIVIDTAINVNDLKWFARRFFASFGIERHAHRATLVYDKRRHRILFTIAPRRLP